MARNTDPADTPGSRVTRPGDWRWTPAIGITLGLLALSLIPGSAPDNDAGAPARLLGFVPPAVQNLGHVPLWAIAGSAWCRAVRPATHGQATVLALASGAVLSVADESIQLFTPGRYASLTDVALDIVGVALGTGLYWRWHRRR